jgi:hypothetical protein
MEFDLASRHPHHYYHLIVIFNMVFVYDEWTSMRQNELSARRVNSKRFASKP